jgi:filamentous hemagglutinin
MNKRFQNHPAPQASGEQHATKCAPKQPAAPIAYLEQPARPWVRNMARALIALLIFESTIAVLPAYAQSVPPNLPTTPHAGAPAGQRPIMDAANNGVPIALIAPPSAGGVSRNQYEQFNVNQNGLILNNSSGNSQTQLGGWIAGNPQLGVTPARIILNEVVSGNPSQLRGTIEVAGHRADIVVANPNGITCDGCGFLNTGRASLTTGAPQFGADGGLTGFDVRQGQLTVGGLGLNASNLEQLDLIARGIVIEGEVWAKNLNVIAGTNQVLYGTLQAAAQSGNGAAPGFAIDIKDVGGMYANQIYMVATEQGLGVNSTGRMAALQGNLTLSANGDLKLQDTYAKQDLRIASAGKLELNGQTQSDGGINATAGGLLDNRGAIDAQGRLALTAGAVSNTGTVAQRNGEGAALTAAGQFSNSGMLFSAGELGITAGSIADTGGRLLSVADLRLQAGQINLTNTQIMTDGSMRITSTAGLAAQGTDVRAAADIVADAGSAISNTDGAWQAANDISLTAASISNRGSTLLANGRLDISATAAIDNTDGNLLAAGTVRLNGLSLTNEGGQIISDADASVSLNGSLRNDDGLISAKGNLALNTGSGSIANTAGTIVADGGLDIIGGNLSNTDGVIAAMARQNQVLNIQAAGITNQGGLIDSAGAMRITATGAVDNAGGMLQSGTDAATTDGTAHIDSASMINNGGRVVARDALTITTGTLSNDKVGTVQGILASAAGRVGVTATAITNVGGLITAASGTSISSDALDNTGGELSSGADLGIDTGANAFINDGGSLLARGDIAVQAGTFRSNALAGGQAATIAASNDVVINAAGFSNDGSNISAGRDIRIRAGAGSLFNQGGAIEAQRALVISAGAIDTRAGRMIANDALSIQAASVQAADVLLATGGALDIDSTGALVNTRGIIASDKTVGINAASLDNTDGMVAAGTHAEIRLGSGLLDNTRGGLIGTQALVLQSGEVRNVRGVLASGTGLAINTQNRVLDNTGGQIVSTGDLRIDSARFDNDAGTAASIEGTLVVDTHGNELSSNAGRLQAQGDVTLATGGFNNRDGLVVGSNITAQTGNLDNHAGQVIAAGNLAVISQTLNNHAGLLQAVGNAAIDTQGQALVNTGSGTTGGIIAGGALTIQAGSLDNKAGYVASNGSQTLTVAGVLDNRAANGQAGQIVSNAGTGISAGSLLNTGGYVGTLGNVSVDTGLLDNRAGQMAASGNPTLTATTLNNSTEGGVGGSIDAGSISVTGAILNNDGGAMRSANDASYSVASFSNSAGTASAKKSLSITATSLSNTGGSLLGDTSVTVTTSSQSPGGTIASAHDVTLNINGNYSNSGLLSAQRDLTVNAVNITNSGTLKAGDTLTANTGNLTNSGEISAETTNLNVSGTLTNTATGLIDGVYTNIDAGTTNNTGRIYGDVLRIKGNTVNNSGTGTIAARDTLLIGAQQVNNTNGALIYGLGNIAMADNLDAGGNPTGQVQQLLNASARIEAVGNIDMAAANLTNRNDALTTRIATTTDAINKTYIQPNGSVTKYDAAVLGWDPYYKENSGRYVLPSTTYPFAQYGATQMLLSNQSFCFNFVGEDAEPCPVVHNYPIGHPAWALFSVSPPDFSDLSVPVMPPASLENFYGDCMLPDSDTGTFVQNNAGACGTYWTAKLLYDQTVTQRTASAESLLDSRISSFNSDVVSRSFEVWNEYQINERSTSETVIDSTSPTQIIAGGSINISGSGTKLNDNSQIIAGGAINIGGTSVINQAAEGTRSITESGQVRFRRIEHHGGIRGNRYEIELHPWSQTTGTPYVETFPLPGYSYTSYAGNQAASRNLSVLTGAPSAAVAAASLSAIGQNRSIGSGSVNAVLPSGSAFSAAANAPLTVVRVDAADTGAQARDVILSTLPRLVAPSNSLFRFNPQPGARYLVETDPRFTNYRSFLNSDYMLKALSRDPERQLKRYGDGFYEQQLVNDQILALTGRRYLTGYSNTEAEYQALMNAGVAFAQKYQLSPGVALSAEQMALLTTDIVWLTEQTVTLPDGNTQQVLMPQVYLRRPRDGDLQQSGALIAGSDIRITTDTDLVNSGTIAADGSATLLAGRDLINEGGRISGQDILARANNGLKNLSGVIQGTGADSNITLLAGRDIVLQTRTIASSTEASATTAASSRVSVNRIATVQGGNVRLDAGRDLIGIGSSAQAEANLIATAGRDIKVSAVAGSYQIDIQRGGNTKGRTGFIKEASITNRVASFSAGNNVTLVASAGDVELKGTDITAGNNAIIRGANVTVEAVKDRQMVDVQNVRRHGYNRAMVDDEALAGGNVVAGNNLTVRATGSLITTQAGDGTAPATSAGDVRLAGAYLSAKEGQATIVANNNVTLDTVTTEHRTANESYSKIKGLLNKKTTKQSSLTADQLANGSAVIGNTVAIQSGQDMTIRGSTVLGSGDVVITAQQGHVAILAGESTSTESHFKQEKRSGIFASKVGVGVSISKSEQKSNFDGAVTTQSENRSVVGTTGGNVIITAGKDTTIKGSDLIANKAKDDNQGATGHIDILAHNITIEPGQDTSRTKATAEAKHRGITVAVVGTLVDTARNLKDVQKKDGKFARTQGTIDELMHSGATTPQMAINFDRSQSSSQTTTNDLVNSGSTLIAAGDIRLRATGDGVKDAAGKASNGDITVTGSTINAGGLVQLDAQRNVTLQASTDQYRQNTQASSKSTHFSTAMPSIGDTGRAMTGGPNNSGVGQFPYSKTNTSDRSDSAASVQSATTISGNDIVLNSRSDDIRIAGSGVAAVGDIDVVAQLGKIDIASGEDRRTHQEEHKAKTIGDLGQKGSTGTSNTVGVHKESSTLDSTESQQNTMRSALTAGRNITVDARQDITVQGTDLRAGKDLTLIGQNIDLDSGQDTSLIKQTSATHQAGSTIGASGYVVDAVKALEQAANAYEKKDDKRLAALYGAKAGLILYSNLQGTGTPPIDGIEAPKNNAGAAIKITVSVGSKSADSQSEVGSTTNQGSTLTAGDTVSLIATGNGDKDADGNAVDGDISARGTRIAGTDVILAAARDIDLHSTQDTTRNRSENTSSNSSVGIGFGLGGEQNGFTLELAAAKAKGQANGDSVTNHNTRIAATNTVVLDSGRDALLKGAQIKGDSISANVGRDLSIESLQDADNYHSQQKNSGFALSLCIPPFCYGAMVSGTISSGKANTDSDYRSVTEQSGMYAGTGSFDVTVIGKCSAT